MRCDAGAPPRGRARLRTQRVRRATATWRTPRRTTKVPNPTVNAHSGNDTYSAMQPAKPSQDTTGQIRRLSLGKLSASNNTMLYQLSVNTFATSNTGRNSKVRANAEHRIPRAKTA